MEDKIATMLLEVQIIREARVAAGLSEIDMDLHMEHGTSSTSEYVWARDYMHDT